MVLAFGGGAKLFSEIELHKFLKRGVRSTVSLKRVKSSLHFAFSFRGVNSRLAGIDLHGGRNIGKAREEKAQLDVQFSLHL